MLEKALQATPKVGTLKQLLDLPGFGEDSPSGRFVGQGWDKPSHGYPPVEDTPVIGNTLL